ncbi:MAG: hypothetical protein IT379_16475 [Deltaproteobacteria bacterium]|nr:hypothetical protein [Deltaproteobacteria bacterium]
MDRFLAARGHALRGLLVVVSLRALACGDDYGADCQCPTGHTCCGGACVDLSSNETHCGRCGSACPRGQQCYRGVCEEDSCEPRGLSTCPDFVCVDTSSDHASCGACGRACAQDERCVLGECLPEGCPIAGIDLDHDEHNCGGCRIRCPSGAECRSGECACVGGGRICDDRCVDTDSDPDGCGDCGRVCRPGAVCDAGACVCPAGTAECSDSCRDLRRDPDACGACGWACALDASCRDGRCACPDALQLCLGRYCADLSTDEMDCGECGLVCGEGLACVAGTCVADGGASCARVCGGRCVGASDPSHCGGCDRVVPASASCIDDRIVCAPGTIDCDPRETELDCVPSRGGLVCGACNDGLGCIGGLCTEGSCGPWQPWLWIEVACGGPHRAGGAPFRCRAYGVSDGLARDRVELTTSRFLYWAAGRCEGAACRTAGGADAPSLLGGPGGFDDSGIFVPAGQHDPSAITSETRLHVTARFQLGPLDRAATIVVQTVPE